MISKANEVGKILAIGYFRRFFASCKMIKDIIDSSFLGKVIIFDFQEGEKHSWPAASASFFKKESSGGGALIDGGSHTIDLLLWWLGDVEQLRYADDSMGGVEVNCHLEVEMQSGAKGKIRISREWPLANQYIIYFEKGSITYFCDNVKDVELNINNLTYKINCQIIENSLRKGPVPDFYEYFSIAVQNVLDSIKDGVGPAISGDEGLKSLEVIEQCYKNRNYLPMPWYSEEEKNKGQELQLNADK